ncbi:MAG: hypothetical protein Q9227_002252 [Pyrenula ochraceoflavens]
MVPQIEIFVTPFHRLFKLSDPAKAYPHALHEHVPPYSLLVLSIGLPLIAVLVVLLLAKDSSPQKIHVAILGLIVALTLTGFLTDVIKNAVGRPRPDLIDRCKPKKGTPADKLIGIEVCTETDHHVLHDGWRSFPSGHSSFSFSGLGYLSFFLAGQLQILRPRSRVSLFFVLAAVSPLLGALLIAISRLEDYRHDIIDVTSGSLLGIAMAYFAYRRYFPPLTSRHTGVPHSKQAAGSIDHETRNKEDEEAAIADAKDFELGDLGDEDVPEESMPLTDTRRSVDDQP